MAVFIVLCESDSAELATTIAREFPGDLSRKVASGQWLVSGQLTAEGVIQKLGATEGKYGRIWASLVTSYYGWHDTGMWDWVQLQRKAIP